jgi:hypothetical protein
MGIFFHGERTANADLDRLFRIDQLFFNRVPGECSMMELTIPGRRISIEVRVEMDEPDGFLVVLVQGP